MYSIEEELPLMQPEPDTNIQQEEHFLLAIHSITVNS